MERSYVQTTFCHHCNTLMTPEEYAIHRERVLLPLDGVRAARGGVFVSVGDDEYWAPTVEELKSEGFRIQIRYYRRWSVQSTGDKWYDRLAFASRRVLPKGGATHVLLLAPDGYWAEGFIRCHHKDVFSKKVGYVLAVNKALSELPGQLYNFDHALVEGLRNG